MRVDGKVEPLPDLLASLSNNGVDSFIMLSPHAGASPKEEEHLDEGFPVDGAEASVNIIEPEPPADVLSPLSTSNPPSVGPCAQARKFSMPSLVSKASIHTAADKFKGIDWKYWAWQAIKFGAQLATFAILAKGVIMVDRPSAQHLQQQYKGVPQSDQALVQALTARVDGLEQLVKDQGAQLLAHEALMLHDKRNMKQSLQLVHKKGIKRHRNLRKLIADLQVKVGDPNVTGDNDVSSDVSSGDPGSNDELFEFHCGTEAPKVIMLAAPSGESQPVDATADFETVESETADAVTAEASAEESRRLDAVIRDAVAAAASGWEVRAARTASAIRDSFEQYVQSFVLELRKVQQEQGLYRATVQQLEGLVAAAVEATQTTIDTLDATAAGYMDQFAALVSSSMATDSSSSSSSGSSGSGSGKQAQDKHQKDKHEKESKGKKVKISAHDLAAITEGMSLLEVRTDALEKTVEDTRANVNTSIDKVSARLSKFIQSSKVQKSEHNDKLLEFFTVLDLRIAKIEEEARSKRGSFSHNYEDVDVFERVKEEVNAWWKAINQAFE